MHWPDFPIVAGKETVIYFQGFPDSGLSNVTPSIIPHYVFLNVAVWRDTHFAIDKEVGLVVNANAGNSLKRIV